MRRSVADRHDVGNRAAALGRREVVILPEPWRSAPVMVVLPTFNEAANLPLIVAALLELAL